MSSRNEFFSTWELLRFDGAGSTRQIVNLISPEHPLYLLADKHTTLEQRWSLLWYTRIDKEFLDGDIANIQKKLDGDNWYLFNS